MNSPSFLGDDDTIDGDVSLLSDINITPFCDVVLVVLIIFMVSSSAMVDAAHEGRLEVNLPKAASTQPARTYEPTLIVGIARDGRLFVDGRFITPKNFGDVLHKAYEQSSKTMVIIDADGSLPHHQVVTIIDIVRKAGFANVGIGAEQAP